jgi:hypothetical protein
LGGFRSAWGNRSLRRRCAVLRSVKELFGYQILATDGDVGKVDDFFFDDRTWTIRYVVVETGGWLGGRKVLLIPAVLGEPRWEDRSFPVSLTKRRVEKSPDIDVARPVHRQHEIALHEYYSWIPYWDSGTEGLMIPPQVAIPVEVKGRGRKKKKEKAGDPHLRSAREVMGYHIHAKDGEIGHVDEFILDDTAWIVRYLVVDTRNWLPGRKVLISPHWVDGVSWDEARVNVGLDREKVKNSPEYLPSAPVNRRYEERLYDYYGRPTYWD